MDIVPLKRRLAILIIRRWNDPPSSDLPSMGTKPPIFFGFLGHLGNPGVGNS